MMSMNRLTTGAIAALMMSACATVTEPYEQPDAPIPDALPVVNEEGDVVEPIYWQDVFLGDELRELVRLALAENRDLRIAAANVQLARAQYGISRAQRFPTVSTVT